MNLLDEFYSITLFHDGVREASHLIDSKVILLNIYLYIQYVDEMISQKYIIYVYVKATNLGVETPPLGDRIDLRGS